MSTRAIAPLASSNTTMTSFPCDAATTRTVPASPRAPRAPRAPRRERADARSAHLDRGYGRDGDNPLSTRSRLAHDVLIH